MSRGVWRAGAARCREGFAFGLDPLGELLARLNCEGGGPQVAADFPCPIGQGVLVVDRPVVGVLGGGFHAVAAGKEQVGTPRVADQDVADANAAQAVRIDRRGHRPIRKDVDLPHAELTVPPFGLFEIGTERVGVACAVVEPNRPLDLRPYSLFLRRVVGNCAPLKSDFRGGVRVCGIP